VNFENAWKTVEKSEKCEIGWVRNLMISYATFILSPYHEST
jgi:hypothetical protein